MNKEDKKLQKHLVDEMMQVYETNPNVMLYMEALMKKYEELEQENKQLKKKYENAVADYELEKYKNSKAIEYIEQHIYYDDDLEQECTNMIFNLKEQKELLEILGDKE